MYASLRSLTFWRSIFPRYIMDTKLTANDANNPNIPQGGKLEENVGPLWWTVQ